VSKGYRVPYRGERAIPQEKSQHDFIVASLPARWAKRAIDRAQLFANDWGEEREARITTIMESVRDMRTVRPSILASDDDLRAEAERMAKDCTDFAGLSVHDVRHRYATLCARYGIVDDCADWANAHLNSWLVARCTDASFWLRKLRVVHGRRLESAAIDLGVVHRRADCYASDETVTRRRQQIKRNAASVAAMDVEDDDGVRLNLADVIEKSVANKAIRRGELMTRIRGFEEWANQKNEEARDTVWRAVFVTLTCPSRMHARHSRSGELNEKYDGTKPREANKYLGVVWQRVRALLHRAGVKSFGFRVAEPHHDGTPHHHFLLWVRDEFLSNVVAAFYEHGLRDSWNERGAFKYRIKVECIDPARGSAVGYIAKYIAKNIDGYKLQTDLYGNDAIEASERIESWASTWGIRQFQQIGGPPVGVWREARRVEEGAPMDSVITNVVDSVNRKGEVLADWSAFVNAMGGATLRRRDYRLHLLKEKTTINGRYGLVERDRPVGLVERSTGICVRSERRLWRLVRWDTPIRKLGLVSITVRGERHGNCGNGFLRGSSGAPEKVFSGIPGEVHRKERREDGSRPMVCS
jgi:Bacteriophage replication gene A protein (GPA)